MAGRGTRSKEWCLKAPDGTIHRFENLASWVKDNADLFDADDVIPYVKKTYGPYCTAAARLYDLRPGKLRTTSGWKGWTWVADDG